MHRDIKPENVMITSGGELYLLDLDAAHHPSVTKDADTKLLGTHGYAAPEQYGFGVSNVQADIYAAGILLNQMLTGEVSRERIAAGKTQPIIERCLRLDPKDRYRDVSELLSELRSIQDSREESSGTGNPDRPGSSVVKSAQKNRLWLFLLVSTGLFVLGFATAWWWRGTQLAHVEGGAEKEPYLSTGHKEESEIELETMQAEEEETIMPFIPDYMEEASFESDLNKGLKLDGKTVTFTVKELLPNSYYGYNLVSGKHLNFVSSKNPGVAVGDRLTVKVTEILSVLQSWIIYYEMIEAQ